VLRAAHRIRFTATFQGTTSVTLTLNQQLFTNPSDTTPAADTTATLLSNVQPPSSGSYFTYGYIDSTTGAAATTTAPTDAQLLGVYLVTESFGQRVTSRPVYTSTTVSLRNATASTA